MEGCSWASREGRDRSTIETCRGICMSFHAVSDLLWKLLAGAERVPRLCERHAKGPASVEAGDAPLYVRQGARRGTRLLGWAEQREGQSEEAVSTVAPGQAVTLAACRPSTTVRMRASHAPAQESGSAYLLSMSCDRFSEKAGESGRI
jgi:hypothetical protein